MVENKLKKAFASASGAMTRQWVRADCELRKLVRSESGQGTTEYAILVGVLVVIAILAIMVFRPRLQDVW